MLSFFALMLEELRMRRVSVGHLAPAQGERGSAMIAVPGVEPAWEMPVVIVRGAQDGPTLTVTGGVHAAEYVSIEAVTRLSRWADQATLRGTLVAVLIVNTPGFFEHSIYVNPVDGKNFGGIFPGSPDGTASERVSDYLWREIIQGSDAYIDAHCGDMIEALAPFTLWPRVEDADVSARSHAMAQAYGLDRTLGMDYKNVPGRSYAEVAARGIPAIVGEVGQQGICDERFVQIHLRGLQNVMAHLGMVDPLGPPPALPRELQGLAWTRSSAAGTYHPCVAIGDTVRKGQPTGELHDLFGNTIEEHLSPADGEVVFLVTALAVAAGGPLIGIGVYNRDDARDARALDNPAIATATA
jgi:predicted deacylase